MIKLLFLIIFVFCEDKFDCSAIGGFQVNEKCFRFLPERSSHVNKARFDCKLEFHPAASVGIIRSAEEQELILKYVSENDIPKHKYWLGFNPVPYDALVMHDLIPPLMGVDSIVYNYSNWAPNPSDGVGMRIDPNARKRRNVICVYMNGRHDFKWRNSQCQTARGTRPFCELDLSLAEIAFPNTIDDIYHTVDPSNEGCEGEGDDEAPLIDESQYIFQIGFNRAGTTSLSIFFDKNGIKSCHFGRCRFGATMYKNYVDNKLLMEDVKEVYYDTEGELKEDECTFFSDLENFPTVYAYIRFFKVLDQQYPNAKFILNLREKEGWMNSRKSLIGGRYVKATARFHNVTDEEIFDIWRETHDQHVNNVLEHFEGRPDKLLVFDILNDDGEKLADFFSDWFDLDPNFWGKHNSQDEEKGDRSKINHLTRMRELEMIRRKEELRNRREQIIHQERMRESSIIRKREEIRRQQQLFQQQQQQQQDELDRISEL